MKKNSIILFLVFLITFVSCDKEVNTLGADLIGAEHFDFSSYQTKLKAYSIKTDEVQTNNLPINPLGIYNNPYFGVTKSDFITQASLAQIKPKFGTNVQIENVTLYIPYFSSVVSSSADGSRVYKLQSIFGNNKESKMNLSVYENGYFLNSFNPTDNFQTQQRYFSDGSSNGTVIDFNNFKRGDDGNGNSTPNGAKLNNSTNTAENTQFFFNKAEIIVYKTKFNTTTGVLEYVDANDVVLANQNDVSLRVIKERLAPGIYLNLNKSYFKKRILDASAVNLFNNNDFKQYFRGLYFKIDQIPGEEGAMANINFSNAKLNINYSSVNDGAEAGTLPTSKTFNLNLGVANSSNSVSLQNYFYSGAYNTGLLESANNPSFGSDSKLYLKGGKGSVVFLDVFGDADVMKPNNGILVSGSNGVPDELDELRLNGWLINDAYFEFFVDQSSMAGANQLEVERLYLYDATNQKPLVDYTFDTSINSNPKSNKILFGGIIERDESANKKGIKYKIRVTQHIKNLIANTDVNLSKNIRFGLSVTENIMFTDNYFFKTPLPFSSLTTDDDINRFPAGSIMEHEGVVLHGTNPSAADASKKLKLVIHYTKPN